MSSPIQISSSNNEAGTPYFNGLSKQSLEKTQSAPITTKINRERFNSLDQIRLQNVSQDI